MSTDIHLHWKTKLAAWTHDPAEKALVLMRDPAGHEGGTVADLRAAVFGPGGAGDDVAAHIRRADHWAAAADRPQFPRSPRDGRYPPWTQVKFDTDPELVHPLSGERYRLQELGIAARHVRAVSTDHFRELIQRDGDAVDLRRTALAFWRFGPEHPAEGLGALWNLLPADTRVPDHTIWAHLDLTAAFATAFALDAEATPALLTVSLGPVQDFIAQARTTSDLWAGSHLLSRLSWEAMRVVCEQVGPDAILFPQLRGVPQVDLWLASEMKLDAGLFETLEWRKESTDANPLFAAALPNRFVAVVPSDQAAAIAAQITETVRAWVRCLAREMWAMLVKAAGIPQSDDHHAYTQIDEQLAGFPEVHWAAVSFGPYGQIDSSGTVDTTELRKTLARFHAEGNESFLDSEAWKLLSRDLKVDGATFYRPNPGTLYPAIYALLDHVQAAAKAARPFRQTRQTGYRCSLTGEGEWLCVDRSQLHKHPNERADLDTVWARVATARPAWARKGEHLGALAMLKRLWPSRFAQEVAEGTDLKVQRYVVSTHTLAMATTLDRWLSDGADLRLDDRQRNLLQCDEVQPAALPRRLVRRLYEAGAYASDLGLVARRLPGVLDLVREHEAVDPGAANGMAEVARQLVAMLPDKPETYYALILFDGDRLGAWLSGSGEHGRATRLPYRASWHSQVRNHLDGRNAATGGDLGTYLDERRAVSPARHMAISAALNSFALQLARHVVEDLCKGKLIYAGGDDVLAMVCVDDLSRAMLLLRLAYAGVFPPDEEAEKTWDLLGVHPGRRGLTRLGSGHALYDDRLLRLMGHRATASLGAVVAHHQSPLGAVLRELRRTEARAKAAGRDSFAISLLKRSGGAVQLAAPWLAPGGAGWENLDLDRLMHGPMGYLIRLTRAFGGEGFSRRAAYLTQDWIEDLPDRRAVDSTGEYADLLATTLGYQFSRQAPKGTNALALGRELGKLAVALTEGVPMQHAGPDPAVDRIHGFLAVAEFLAREGRGGLSSREEAA